MKKVYEKPAVVFENFTLNTAIAGSCEFIVNNSTKYICAYYDEREGKHVFTSEIMACTTKQEEGSNNGICYHVPVDTHNLFNS